MVTSWLWLGVSFTSIYHYHYSKMGGWMVAPLGSWAVKPSLIIYMPYQVVEIKLGEI